MALDPKIHDKMRDPKAQAALALHRFGLGPRSGTVNAIASDPRGALIVADDLSNTIWRVTPVR